MPAKNGKSKASKAAIEEADENRVVILSTRKLSYCIMIFQLSSYCLDSLKHLIVFLPGFGLFE